MSAENYLLCRTRDSGLRRRAESQPPGRGARPQPGGEKSLLEIPIRAKNLDFLLSHVAVQQP